MVVVAPEVFQSVADSVTPSISYALVELALLSPGWFGWVYIVRVEGLPFLIFQAICKRKPEAAERVGDRFGDKVAVGSGFSNNDSLNSENLRNGKVIIICVEPNWRANTWESCRVVSGTEVIPVWQAKALRSLQLIIGIGKLLCLLDDLQIKRLLLLISHVTSESLELLLPRAWTDMGDAKRGTVGRSARNSHCHCLAIAH